MVGVAVPELSLCVFSQKVRARLHVRESKLKLAAMELVEETRL